MVPGFPNLSAKPTVGDRPKLWRRLCPLLSLADTPVESLKADVQLVRLDLSTPGFHSGQRHHRYVHRFGQSTVRIGRPLEHHSHEDFGQDELTRVHLLLEQDGCCRQ